MLADFPHLKRWFEEIKARPATQRAYAKADEINKAPVAQDEESRKILFSQTGAVVR
jgi:GST-like protein